MKLTHGVLAAALPLAAALTLIAPAANAAPAHSPQPSRANDCAAVTVAAPSGAKVVKVASVAHAGGTVQFPVQPGYQDPPAPVTDVPAYCQVDVTLTHGTAGDRELIEVWLPQKAWNGRFQALGGSGYAAGDFGPDLANAVKQGYAVGSQDAGATPVTGFTAPWALKANGTVNQAVLKNFASRGVHELALVGEAAVKKYYGSGPNYSYWNGCSTGGRQGYVEAQQFPTDFDGILAAAPALSWDQFAVADLWPNVVIQQQHDLPTAAEFDAFNAAAIAAADAQDGIKDGLSENPFANHFDPRTLIGKTIIDSNGQPDTISAADAEVVREIWNGPTDTHGKQLWPGLPRGADFDTPGLSLASGSAFAVAGDWVASFLKQDPSFDVNTVTYAQFVKLYKQSQAEYHSIIGSDDPDLSSFDRAGGKLLSWQGTADQLVPIGGTTNYYDSVAAQKQHGHDSVSDYYRLFLAPGASHCAPGAGPAPSDPLGALEKWVEHGQAPATLAATGTLADGTVLNEQIRPYQPTPAHQHH